MRGRNAQRNQLNGKSGRMIKSTKETNNEPEEFPILITYPNGAVILATRRTSRGYTGVCLSYPNASYLGAFSEEWSSADVTIYRGKVILENV